MWLGNLGDWVPTNRLFIWRIKWPEKSISKCTVWPRLSISTWDTPMEDYRNLPYKSFPSQFFLTWEVINMPQTTKYIFMSYHPLLTEAKTYKITSWTSLLTVQDTFPRLLSYPVTLLCPGEDIQKVVARGLISLPGWPLVSCCSLGVGQLCRYLRSSAEAGKHACAGSTFSRIELIWWDKQLTVVGEHNQAYVHGRKVRKYGERKGIQWSFSRQPFSDPIPKS